MLAMCVSAYAQKSFNDEQLRLRGNIERFLREEGYMPEIDSDGDIKFKREGSSYYVIIDARDTSPMYLTLSKYFSYGEKYNRSVLSANLADFNLKKGVKLVLFDDSYCLQAQMYLVNADSFNYVFYKLLKQLDALDEDIDDVCLSSGSGSSYSSGSNYSSSGSLLVNETFSSPSYSWRAQDGGRLQFQNGKMIFEDTKDKGYVVLSYNLPQNITYKDFELSFTWSNTFKEDWALSSFFIGSSYTDCYRFSLSRGTQNLSASFGTWEDFSSLARSSSSLNLNPYYTYKITMRKVGSKVDWYADNTLLFTATIGYDTDLTTIGFMHAYYNKMEIDDVKIKLL